MLKSGTKKHKNSNEKKVVVSKNMNKKVLGQKNNNKRNIKAIHINKDNKFIYNITNKEIKKKHNYFIKTNTTNAKIMKRKNLDIEKKMQDNINKAKNIMEYTDEEINILPYNLALKYDKRSYCNFYISLLKTKHKLIFALYNNDYNSRIIKISLFLIEFTIDYVVNALFYNDDTMHKIYESKGQFDLEVQIPIIVYSSLISMLLNKPLCLLALSNDAIINFKQKKSTFNLTKRAENLINNLVIKFIFYFIISSIFLVLFWYYISMFGVIYSNTQIHLLKDTLMSFGISLVIPFVIYLFPGFFSIPSLSNRRKKRKCLYNFSNVLKLL